MSPRLAGRRVLVVEDEYLLATDLACALREDGADVLGPVASVHAALDLLDDAPRLDGAVVDLHLQGEMAYPLVDALRARCVPLVLATGYDASVIASRYADVPRCEKPAQATAIARALFG